MGQATDQGHTCYRCAPHDVQGPFRQQGDENAPELESAETTFSEGGDDIYYASGYGAREIALTHAKESGGTVYVNHISRKIKRHDLNVPVAYAVAKSPIYTLRPPDGFHSQVYRAYWRPL